MATQDPKAFASWADEFLAADFSEAPPAPLSLGAKASGEDDGDDGDFDVTVELDPHP